MVEMLEVKIHFPYVVFAALGAALREEIDALAVGSPSGREVVAGMVGKLCYLAAVGVGTDNLRIGTNCSHKAECSNEKYTFHIFKFLVMINFLLLV